MLYRGSIAIVTNSDIYFDDSLRQLEFGSPTSTNSTRSAFALSRRHAPECGKKRDWKSINDLCTHYIGSHDAFVFAPPVGARVLKNTDHTQNHFGAENIVVWAFMWASPYKGRVYNPCQRIHAYHYHCVSERHYTIGKFISKGRHGNVAPGIKNWNGNWYKIF